MSASAAFPDGFLRDAAVASDRIVDVVAGRGRHTSSPGGLARSQNTRLDRSAVGLGDVGEAAEAEAT